MTEIHSRARLSLFLALLFVTQSVFAGLEFVGPDIGTDDTILFAARVDIPGETGYDTLFAANAVTGRLEQQTFFPEAIALVDDGQRLQIRNRFGIFMTERGFVNIKPVQGLPSFVQGAMVQMGRLIDSMPSPDGSMILYLSPISVARANLVLFNIQKGTETIVARNIEFSVDRFPARWSPDSRYFVYSRTNQLYYYSIEQLNTSRLPDESWRLIGSGRIEQARWSINGSLYVLRDRSMYRIMPEEFFTQAIYAGIIPPGTLVGKAPFAYDPNFDSFYISPDGSRVLLCKDGRNIFLYHLDPDDFGREDSVNAMPYLFLQGNTTILSVLWPASNEVTIFTGALKNGERITGAYRIRMPAPGSISLVAEFLELNVQGALSLSLSPDEKHIAVSTPDKVRILSYLSWTFLQEIPSARVRQSLWVDNQKIIIAGSDTVELIDLSQNTRQLIAISQAKAYGWTPENQISVQTTAGTYIKQANSQAWQQKNDYSTKIPATTNGNFRVYTDALAAGTYKNMLMVRSVKGLGTRSLIPAPTRTFKPFPAVDDQRSPLVFDHGSRIRRRDISLVINAYDGAEGLIGILETLRLYGIKATFFLNGEFMRRNPGATRMIAESGHEVGNMFFSTFDPTDSRYRIDAEFIQRGLARTEDDYFDITGKELSLIWHTPHYTANSLILEAAAKMNYTYIGRDIDPLDWVGRLAGSRTPGLYLPSHLLVERISETVRPGSIIPIRLGLPDAGREDYLFNELPLLINALISDGYAIVPVSSLLEHAY